MPLVGTEVAEFAVGPVLIVVEAEVFNDDASFAQVEQQFAVEALVAYPGVEALDPAVLPRAARLYRSS
jgi:hypothetical protein